MESVALIMIIIKLWIWSYVFFQETSHSFIHPELTNCTILVNLKFDTGLDM